MIGSGSKAKLWGLILLFSSFIFKYCANANTFFYSNRGGFPSGAFGNIPGFGGGPVENSEYYETLGVSKDASENEIKRAYRKLAIQKHPDKGGDPEEFKQLSEAYDVLSDPDKKRVYDQYGKAGLEGGSQGAGGGMEDMFSSFFGGMGGMGGPARARDVMYTFEVSLEDLYQGATKKVQMTTRKVVNGRLMAEPKTLEIHIEKGMQNRQRIILHGEAESTVPGVPPGDYIFELIERPHPVFKRQNTDLLMELKISLAEALTGFSRQIKLLSGKIIWIKAKPGEVIGSGSFRAVPEAGMPVHGQIECYGRLFIKFNVEFPEKLTLTDDQVKQLCKILPQGRLQGKKKPQETDEVIELEDVDLASFGKDSRSTFHEHMHEDQDSFFQSDNVQCHQQ